MKNQTEKLIGMEDLDQLERNNLGLYIGEMDNCIRSSSILYSRLFARCERIRVADRRQSTRISTHS